LFVENMGVRAPRPADAGRVVKRVSDWTRERGGRRPRRVAPNLDVFSPLVLPPFGWRATRLANRRVLLAEVRRAIERLGFRDPILITWLPTDTAVDLAEILQPAALCYFCIADFAELVEKRGRLAQSETQLLRASDVVFAHAQATYEHCARVARCVELVPPSVSLRQFALAPPPASRPHTPRIGYVGGLHRVVDYELVAACARLRPGWRWELVGPIQHPVGPLASLENVALPGAASHDELPDVIAGFDICAVPYLTGPEHASVAPTKINEYLSVGKPVVATALPWVRAFQERHGVLEVVRPEPQEFVAGIERALATITDPALTQQRREAAAESDWSVRMERISELIEDAAQSRRPPAHRVLALAPYPPDTAPSQRYRFEQYLGALRSSGIEVEVSPLLSVSGNRIVQSPGRWAAKAAVIARGAAIRVRDLLRARRYDAVVVHREAFPIGPAWVERALAALGTSYLYDFDDAVYLPNVSEANRAFGRLKAPGKVAAIVRHAGAVIAGNDHLAEWAGQHNPNVRVIPTTIDTNAYGSRVAGSPADRVVIGWTGSSTTIQHLEPLGPLLRELQAEHGVGLRVISDVEFGIDGADIENVRWSSATEAADLAAIDIGVMPLPDEEWARGKCGAKALQFMAMGIPTVMSPVGANVKIARDGAALLASTPDEWRRALTDLIEDPQRRRRIGDAGRRRVVEEYSVHANAGAWRDALLTVAVG
jgi:glycosyltransferase involved in cell wall biosynthesis